MEGVILEFIDGGVFEEDLVESREVGELDIQEGGSEGHEFGETGEGVGFADSRDHRGSDVKSFQKRVRLGDPRDGVSDKGEMRESRHREYRKRSDRRRFQVQPRKQRERVRRELQMRNGNQHQILHRRHVLERHNVKFRQSIQVQRR